jgi:hypothetical protein
MRNKAAKGDKLPRFETQPDEEVSMPVETPSLFAQVIQDHLELKRRNAGLEPQMPLERYMHEDPFENHPLFKTEEQARLEETMDGSESIVDEPTSLAWPTVEGSEDATVESSAHEEAGEPDADSESAEGLWTRSRDFDWGD